MTVGASDSGRQVVAHCPACDMRLNWWLSERELAVGAAERHNRFFHGVTA